MAARNSVGAHARGTAVISSAWPRAAIRAAAAADRRCAGRRRRRLREASALVLRAPPGAGKTTRVPPATLDAGLADQRQDPRAAAAARRRPGHRRPHRRRARLAAGRRSRLPGALRIADSVRGRGSQIITEGILLRRLLGRSVPAGVRRSSSSTSSTSARWPAIWRWPWSGRFSSRCGRS